MVWLGFLFFLPFLLYFTIELGYERRGMGLEISMFLYTLAAFYFVRYLVFYLIKSAGMDITSGIRLLESGQFDLAIAHFEKNLKDAPQYASLYTYSWLGQNLSKYDYHSLSCINLIYALALARRPEEARSLLTKLRKEHHPDDKYLRLLAYELSDIPLEEFLAQDHAVQKGQRP